MQALQTLLDAENALFGSTYHSADPYCTDADAFWDAIAILRKAQLQVRVSIFKQINGYDIARWLREGVL